MLIPLSFILKTDKPFIVDTGLIYIQYGRGKRRRDDLPSIIIQLLLMMKILQKFGQGLELLIERM